MSNLHLARRPLSTARRPAALAALCASLLSGCIGGSGGGGGYIPYSYDIDETGDIVIVYEDTAGGDVGTGQGDVATGDVDPDDSNASDDGSATDTGIGGDTQIGEDTGTADTSVTPGCTSAAQCLDSDPCTEDSCDFGTGSCKHAAIAGCGALGSPCSQASPCVKGVCSPASNACVACLTSADCGGGKLCKANACVPATPCESDVQCKTSKQVCAPDQGVCVDCNVNADCEGGQACVLFACVPAQPCTSSKECAKVCDTNAGYCVECTTSKDCTGGSYCGAGNVCRPPVCTGPSCAGLQVYLCRADGSGFDAAANCGDDNVCTDDACDPGKGCVIVANGASCDDGDACTNGDVCSNKACAGKAVDCNDNNPCTGDSCSKSKGCSHSPLTVACDDGSACTVKDVCSGGSCKPGAPLNCNDGNPCTDDSCDKVAGCKNTNNSKPCDDGSACTSGDVCGNGLCAGKAVGCDDNNPCTQDGCDPAGAGCSHDNLSSACSDDNACTSGDVCSFGSCIPGPSLNCDDGNPCTVDSCSPKSGCAHSNVAGSCNDGDPCTTNDACVIGAGTCKGTPFDVTSNNFCDDSNLCTNDSCHTILGCQHTSNTVSCDDGDPCTVGDACKSSVCAAGPTTKDCDDKDLCTLDSCLSGKGCSNLPGSVKCDDGSPCTVDTCDAKTGACAHAAKADCCSSSAQCDDGKPCTVDACVAGVCQHQGDGCCAKDADCTDGDGCTTNTCNGGSCASAPAVGCPQQASITWDFEDGSSQGWTSTGPDAKYKLDWVVVPVTGPTGAKSLNLGLPNGQAFAGVTGVNQWTAESPEFSLPAGRSYDIKVTWRVDLSATSSTYNRVNLSSVYGGKDALRGSRTYLSKGFNTDTFSLDDMAGGKLKLKLFARIGYSTSSSTYTSSGTGIAVDSIVILDKGPPKSCNAAKPCAAGGSCSSAVCGADGLCAYELNCCTQALDCDDGDPCTTDSCSNTRCIHTPIAKCCNKATDCNDKVACTLDTCEGATPTKGGTCKATPTTGCCAADADCNASASSCFAGSCQSGACVYKAICCATDAECADGETTCTKDSCVAGTCAHVDTGAPGCCTPQVQKETFETSPLKDWTFSNSAGTTKGWQVWLSATQKTSGKGALYYGSPATGTFDFGSSSGTATWKVALPTAKTLALKGQIRMDTESSSTYDKLTIQVVAGGAPVTIWSKSSTYIGKFAPIDLNLSSYAGKAIELRFYFTTVDGAGNSGAGVFIDDLEITRSCP